MISPNLLRILAATLLCIPALNGAPGSRIAMPDFTKGDAIPKGAVHDWNLGATGCRGWMFSDKLVTTDARQVFITKVDKGSPADGVLEVGDVIQWSMEHTQYQEFEHLGEKHLLMGSQGIKCVIKDV